MELTTSLVKSWGNETKLPQKVVVGVAPSLAEPEPGT